MFWIGGADSISEGLLVGWALGVRSTGGIGVAGVAGSASELLTFFGWSADLVADFLTVFFDDFLDEAFDFVVVRAVFFFDADCLAADLDFFFEDLEVAGEDFFFLLFLAML